MLCLDDSYAKECIATVIAVTGKCTELDVNLFYPQGGGQPYDTGTITCGTAQFRVVSVKKNEGKIVHELDREPHLSELKVGDQVKCTLDWERRYAFMRIHTAAHVLAATMHTQMGVFISGGQLDLEKSRFDFTLTEVDKEKMECIVQRANEILHKDITLNIYALPREEALKIPGVVKLATALPPSIPTLRIVEIPGVDLQADGGTHVRNLQEVGQLELLKLENKGAENKRMYFRLKKEDAN